MDAQDGACREVAIASVVDVDDVAGPQTWPAQHGRGWEWA
jgi:hypothetical protein